MLLQSLFNIRTEYGSLCGRVRFPTDGIVHDPLWRLIRWHVYDNVNSGTDGIVRMRKDIFCIYVPGTIFVAGYFNFCVRGLYFLAIREMYWWAPLRKEISVWTSSMKQMWQPRQQLRRQGKRQSRQPGISIWRWKPSLLWGWWGRWAQCLCCSVFRFRSCLRLCLLTCRGLWRWWADLCSGRLRRCV